MTEWITAEAAAQRLGIKRATLYAYVSRGVLVRKRAADGRGSLFDPGEVERLALRGRPRHTTGGAEFVIESALTEISGGRLSYRGHEVTTLAATRTFEEVATLLWTGDFHLPDAPSQVRQDTAWQAGQAPDSAGPDSAGPDSAGPDSAWQASGTAGPAPWRATADAVAAGSAAQAALPGGALPLERLQVIVPALAATDQLRLHLDGPAVAAAARAMIAGMVDCLPRPPGTASAASATAPAASAASATAPAVPAASATATAAQDQAGGGGQGIAESSISVRLWGKLCPDRPAPALLGALQSALVLLADHELAASTFAARVAASVRADPYAVVATGLGALGGPLHGGASLGVEAMLAAAATPGDAPRVVGDLLRQTGRVPGFGHFVYQAGDPRAVCLLGLVQRGAPGSPRLAVADAILAEMRRRALPEPNIDFAVAVLKDVTGMVSGAGEAIFAVARASGWIAHALEEYARRSPLRPRAVYTGPPAS